MEKLTTTHIAQLIAQVRGEGGYKKLATKGAGIKQLGNMLVEKYGQGSADETMEALDTAEDMTAATLIITNLKLEHAGAPPVDAVADKGKNTPVEGLDGDTTEEIVPAPKPAKPAKEKKAKKQKAEGEAKASSGRRDKFLLVVPGKDPYRAGTLSAKTWDMMKANPGKTFREYLAMGARANSILDALRRDMVKAVDELPKA